MTDAQSQHAQLEALLALSNDELFAELARSSMTGGLPLPGPKKLSEVGRTLFLGWWPELRRTVCGKFRSARSSGQVERAQDAATILDIILAAHGVLPAATLAVIIAKNGADTLCEGDPELIVSA